MSNDVLFWTQIAGITGYLASLFVIYRILVSSKDATIETLKTHIVFLEAKIATMADTAPDVLLDRVQKRNAALESELKTALSESDSKLALSQKELQDRFLTEIEDLKQRIPPEFKAIEQSVIQDLISLSRRSAQLLNAQLHTERKRLVHQLGEMEISAQELNLVHAQLSPSRRVILTAAVEAMGVDWIINATTPQIQAEFLVITRLAAVSKRPALLGDAGVMTGLRGIGLVDDLNELTVKGVTTLRDSAVNYRAPLSITISASPS